MSAPPDHTAPLSSPARQDPFVFAVCALGITQITAWGTGYYFLGVLAGPIADDTGWPRSFVYFGFTLALLAMGIVSTSVGRAIDRHGARAVMTAGTFLVSAGLVAIARIESQAGYLAAWVVLGIGMRACLYDAAFAALVQVVPSRGRLAISYLTLFGAFASTVFWVIGHYCNEALGWRDTLLVFATINLAVCLPLNWLGLSRLEPADMGKESAAARAAPEAAPLEGRARVVGIVLFGSVMSLNSFVFGVVTVQLVPLLEAAGLATAAAVWVASLKGFAQFGGRLVEITFGRKLEAMSVARIAIGVLPVSFALLFFSQGQLALIVAFTLLMGASQGVITIVRGAVPLALFGTRGYGAVLGLLATPILIVNAGSAPVFALIAEHWGWNAAQVGLIAISAASWIGMELMAQWYRTRTAH